MDKILTNFKFKFLRCSICNLYAFWPCFHQTSLCNFHASWSHVPSNLPCVSKLYMQFHEKPFDIAQQMDLLQPLLFWKGCTGELTAKTKGSDRIAPKMGLSLPQFDKISTPSEEGCALTPKCCVPMSCSHP